MFTCFCSSCNAASFPICMFLFFSLSSGIWRLRSFGLSNPTKGKGQGKGGIRDRFGSGKRNFGSSEGQLCRTSYCLLLCFFFAKQKQTTKPASLKWCDHLNNKKLSFPQGGWFCLSRFSCSFFLASASLVIHTDGAQACFFFFPTKREI